jgi:predicted dehydrogenase
LPESGIKVAVIGAGNWGKNLVKNFYHLGVLAAVVDEDEKRLSQIGKEYPGVKLLNHTSSLWDMPISAVAIATPAPPHYALAKTAVSAKKEVVGETPLTLKAAEAEELAELAKKMVAYLWWGIFCFINPL